eukprot:6714894-Prorocentrum_lima.AAC.1
MLLGRLLRDTRGSATDVTPSPPSKERGGHRANQSPATRTQKKVKRLRTEREKRQGTDRTH